MKQMPWFAQNDSINMDRTKLSLGTAIAQPDMEEAASERLLDLE